MTLPNTLFNFIKRGFKETLLLLPGWASDYRIFTLLDLEYNYVLPRNCSPFIVEQEFPSLLENYGLKDISILGWSLGGFIGYRLGQKFPQKIKEITLVGIRKKYTQKELESLRTALAQNKKAALGQFYRNFFSPKEQETYRWFKNTLWQSYLAEFDIAHLLAGLDYLSTAEINPLAAPPVPLKIIHGQNDKIAPLQETVEIKKALPHVRYSCIAGAGHPVFLNPEFKKVFMDL